MLMRTGHHPEGAALMRRGLMQGGLTRRGLMRGAALAGAGLALAGGRAGPAAAAPMAEARLRAVSRFHLGRMRVTVIDDARFTFPAPAFAANQPEGSAARFLGGYGLPGDFVSLHMQVCLIETGGAKVLLDTGMGDVTFPGNEPDNGRLAAGLAAVGVTPDQIDAVILSHGHPDHVGACSRGGDPMFPKAAYYMAPHELEFWTQKPGAEENFPNFMLGVGNAQLEPVRDRIRPYKDGDEVVPGVTAIAATGHTLGHHAFLLHDGGDRLLHLMDTAVHYLVGTEEPDWALAVEMDPEAAAATRRRLFAQAAVEQVPVAGYHFPFPGVGRIVETGRAWRYVPVPLA